MQLQAVSTTGKVALAVFTGANYQMETKYGVMSWPVNPTL
jgi:hypothetical protein